MAEFDGLIDIAKSADRLAGLEGAELDEAINQANSNINSLKQNLQFGDTNLQFEKGEDGNVVLRSGDLEVDLKEFDKDVNSGDIGNVYKDLGIELDPDLEAKINEEYITSDIGQSNAVNQISAEFKEQIGNPEPPASAEEFQNLRDTNTKLNDKLTQLEKDIKEKINKGETTSKSITGKPILLGGLILGGFLLYEAIENHANEMKGCWQFNGSNKVGKTCGSDQGGFTCDTNYISDCTISGNSMDVPLDSKGNVIDKSQYCNASTNIMNGLCSQYCGNNVGFKQGFSYQCSDATFWDALGDIAHSIGSDILNDTGIGSLLDILKKMFIYTGVAVAGIFILYFVYHILVYLKNRGENKDGEETSE